MNPPPPDLDADKRVLILASRVRDSRMLSHVIESNGMQAAACSNLADFIDAIEAGAGLAFATEEALDGDAMLRLVDWLQTQPAWSDFPLVVLAARQPGRRPLDALERLENLGNVVLLERPLNAQTLVSAARSALRARGRQYETRRHLEEREVLLAGERSAREEAEFAGRMKDEFLATLSHELRTPLSAILGWVHLLRKRAAALPEIVKGVDTIERSARAQARLIEELLDMSRIVTGNVRLEWRMLAPQTLVEAALASVQPALDAKSISVVREFDTDVEPMGGDAQRLQQVLWNLLTNAIKFTPSGGSITVKLGTEEAAIVIDVIDAGDGISAAFLPFVFDRFRQADGSSTRSHGGLGLGLAIVRQLVELHGGNVTVASDGLGHGTSFRVRLPILEQAPPEASTPAILPTGSARSADASSIELRGIAVLLVDDDVDGRETVSRLLEDLGAHVEQAGSAEAALASLRHATPDVLVSDIGMPRVDGNELLRRARSLGHRMPAIALTAFARPEERERTLNAGYDDHLAKPVEPQQLAAAILEAIEQRGAVKTS